MHLTVIGGGAIGGTVAAHMAAAGHDVLVCDSDPEHVAAINRDGLRIEGPVADLTARVPAVTPDGLPDRIERAAIAVKSHHTAAAAELLRGRLAPDGYVVSLQNGMTTGTIASVVGRSRVLAAFVNLGADVVGPGRILQGNIATFRIGEPGGGPVTRRVAELADALPWAEATDNIDGYLWGKEAYGAMLWAGAVSDLTIAEHLADPRYRPLMVAIASEVLEQARATPMPFDGFDPGDLDGSLDRLAAFNGRSGKARSGIYRDLMVRRRRTEVDDLRALHGPLTVHVADLIEAIERGERTCERANLELLAAYERLERLGRPLDAVVRSLPAPPRAPAGPLHAVAVAVKDLVAVAGVPTGNGNPADMAGPGAAQDADVVVALRAAGADVFATAAMLDHAAGATHPDVPETRNPWHPGRTAGGSSGGSAALVAAGVCDLAVGTDTGGSVRIPAHYCGVVGLKPTAGLLPAGGVTPLAPSLDHVGLLGTDVAWVGRALGVLIGRPTAGAASTPRLGIAVGPLAHPSIDPDVAAVLGDALRALDAAFPTIEVDTAAWDRLDPLFGPIFGREAWRSLGPIAVAEPHRLGPETLRLLAAAEAVTAADYASAWDERESLRPACEAVHTGVDAIAGPAVPFVAPATTPPIDTPAGEDEGRFARVHNLTGAPSVVLPCGWSGGLPVGLQLTARVGQDAALLAVAATVERVLDVHPPTRPGTGRDRSRP